MNYKKTKKPILALSVALAMGFIFSGKAYADCESTYGNGEVCLVNKRFEIDKKVRVEDEDKSWEDKVTNVAKDDTVEFKIKIKNKSDDKADDFDDMKMEDFLPDEMYRVGGSGLTEYWDNFEPGETKTFYIKAKVKKDEYDRDENFENCIVNKAEVKWDGEFEGSDTATVCYGQEEVTELPETGSNEMVALLGAGMILAGALIRKSLSFLA
jgi:LPXTG-motif cell wall-anchored protein